MIKKNKKIFSVRMMCKMLRVSPSGYYDWQDRPLSDRAQKNVVLADKIKHIFDDEYSRAGAVDSASSPPKPREEFSLAQKAA